MISATYRKTARLYKKTDARTGSTSFRIKCFAYLLRSFFPVMLVKLFVLIALVAVVMSAPLLLEPVDIQKEWTNWKTTHNKSYPTPEEEATRFKTFEENVRKITEHNKKYEAGEVTWTQGLNHFADQTQEEFARHNLGLRKPEAPGLVGSH
uniref:Cathepsin propeptide inhibitor domain-containing protein n=2 Tax=Dendroctonus ponderosae TaxID=77166 RepID=A0AAR5PNG6_DENPD